MKFYIILTFLVLSSCSIEREYTEYYVDSNVDNIEVLKLYKESAFLKIKNNSIHLKYLNNNVTQDILNIYEKEDNIDIRCSNNYRILIYKDYTVIQKSRNKIILIEYEKSYYNRFTVR